MNYLPYKGDGPRGRVPCHHCEKRRKVMWVLPGLSGSRAVGLPGWPVYRADRAERIPAPLELCAECRDAEQVVRILCEEIVNA